MAWAVAWGHPSRTLANNWVTDPPSYTGNGQKRFWPALYSSRDKARVACRRIKQSSRLIHPTVVRVHVEVTYDV